MADDSTTGSRAASGVDRSSRDGIGERAMPAASMCYVVHDDQIGELHLSRENVERMLASGSFFWLDLHQPTEDDFAVLRDVFRSSGPARRGENSTQGGAG